MPPHTTTTASFIALFLANTSLAVATEPENAAPQELDAAAIERALETGVLFHIDPTWQPLEADSRLSIATVPTLTNGAKAAFSASETQSAIARTLKSGYSVGMEPSAMPAELNRGLSVTDSFKAGIKAGFDAPVGDDMRLKTAAVETQYALGRFGSSMSWAWDTGLGVQTQRDGTNGVASGPRFKLGDDKLALTLKPQVAHTFGPHHPEEFSFAYTAGLKGEIARGVALGIEAFGGTASDTAPLPGMAVHANRSSPALYLGLGLMPPVSLDTSASKFSLEIGALTGTTETERDVTGQIKAAVTW